MKQRQIRPHGLRDQPHIGIADLEQAKPEFATLVAHFNTLPLAHQGVVGFYSPGNKVMNVKRHT